MEQVKKQIRIHRVADLCDDYKDSQYCSLCGDKLTDKFWEFEGNTRGKFAYNFKEFDRVFIEDTFYTIHNEYFIRICKNCFNPKINYKKEKAYSSV